MLCWNESLCVAQSRQRQLRVSAAEHRSVRPSLQSRPTQDRHRHLAAAAAAGGGRSNLRNSRVHFSRRGL